MQDERGLPETEKRDSEGLMQRRRAERRPHSTTSPPALINPKRSLILGGKRGETKQGSVEQHLDIANAVADHDVVTADIANRDRRAIHTGATDEQEWPRAPNAQLLGFGVRNIDRPYTQEKKEQSTQWRNNACPVQIL